MMSQTVKHTCQNQQKEHPHKRFHQNVTHKITIKKKFRIGLGTLAAFMLIWLYFKEAKESEVQHLQATVH